MIVWLLALTACKDGGGPGPGSDPTDSGDSSTEPFDCAVLDAADLGDPPALASDTWTVLDAQPKAVNLYSLVQDHETGTIYAGSDKSGTWRSLDNGDGWWWLQAQITHNFTSVHVAAGVGGVAYRSAGGRLQKTVDDGETWWDQAFYELDPSREAQLVVAIGGPDFDGDTVYLLTSDGVFWRSDDGVETLEEVTQTTIRPELASSHLASPGFRLLGEAYPDGPIVLAADDGVYASTDGMATWQSRLDGSILGRSLIRDPADPDHLAVGTWSGRLYTSDDGGLSWTETRWADTTDRLVPVAVTWGDALYVAVAGALWRSTDAGATWTSTPTDFTAPGSAIVTDWGRLIVGDDANIWMTDDQGATWLPSATQPADLGMATISAHPECPGLVVTGSRCSGGTFGSTTWGDDWLSENAITHYVMALHWDPTDLGRLWAVSDNALWRRDAGAAWEIVYLDYHFHGFVVDPRDGDRLLLGTVGSGQDADASGRVLRSDDGGRTWTDSSAGLPANGASMHTMVRWPDDPDVVLLGTYQGGEYSHLGAPPGSSEDVAGIGLWRSDDDGASWEAVDLAPQEVAWLTESPAGVVALTDDGMWQSTDQGLTWSRVDGPEGWLLGADFHGDLGVVLEQSGRTWRTDDGGASWTELTAPHVLSTPNPLGAVTIAADGSTAWLTAYGFGIWAISL